MALLAFSIVALVVGNDIRQRGLESGRAYVFGGNTPLTGQDAIAIGAWICFLSAVCLNIAVWRLF